MNADRFVWVDMAMNIIQVAALGAILWQVSRLHRGVAAMLRVLRRIDRKITDTKTTAYLAQANHAGDASVAS